MLVGAGSVTTSKRVQLVLGTMSWLLWYEASEEFDPPAWLGREVTGDERFANQRLALQGRPGPEGGP